MPSAWAATRPRPAARKLVRISRQLRGARSFSFAYHPSAEGVIEQAERYRHPFLTAPGTAKAGELRARSGPVLEGDSSVVLTAFQPGRARIVNESADPQSVRFGGQRLDLRPWEIRTLSIVNA